MVWIVYGAQFGDDSPRGDPLSHPDSILNFPAAVAEEKKKKQDKVVNSFT